MKCPECGVEAEEGARGCYNCGHTFERPAHARQTMLSRMLPADHRRRRAVLIAASAVVLMLAVAFMVLGARHDAGEGDPGPSGTDSALSGLPAPADSMSKPDSAEEGGPSSPDAAGKPRKTDDASAGVFRGDAASAPSPEDPAADVNAAGHVTLSAVARMTGTDFAALLDAQGYAYDDALAGWARSDGANFGLVVPANDHGRGFSPAPKGALASGVPMTGLNAAFVLTSPGYGTASDALRGLCPLAIVDSIRPDDDSVVAVAEASSGKKFLVTCRISDGAAYCMAATDEGIGSGLFARVLGCDLGSSVEDAWQAVSGHPLGGSAS